LGEWLESIEWNTRARDAALEIPAGEDGQWVWDEFPHAVEYLVYAHLQRGDDAAAKRELDRLLTTADLQPSFKTAFHLSSIPARYALERGAWEEAASLDPHPGRGLDWDRFWWPEAVTWFARGLGAANVNRIDDARDALMHVEALQAAAVRAGEPAFAANIGVLRSGLQGWIANAEGDLDEAIDHLRAAIELEALTPKQPVTPAPTLPAIEQLGQILLRAGRHADALLAFERSLELTPNRFQSLAGAARAAAAAGDTATARARYEELLAVAAPSSERPELEEAREYLNASR